MLNWFKKNKGTDGTPRVHVVTPVHISKEAKEVIKSQSLRPGMWVRTRSGIGILVDARSDGNLDIMLTDGMGNNIRPVVVPKHEVGQALYSQIPIARRPPDRDYLHAMGYI